MNDRNHRPARLRLRVLALTLLLFAGPAVGLAPPTGAPAPRIQLPDLEGVQVDSEAFADRSLVLIFGDLDHRGVRDAIRSVLEVVRAPRVAEFSVVPMLVVSRLEPLGELRDGVATGKFPRIVLHDENRAAFGAYRILVMPTVVVVGPDGVVVHSMSGPTQHFQETLTAALLFSAGALTREQFQQVLSPDAPGTSATSQARADRLVHLGRELTHHGLYEIAETRFREAVEIAPDNLEARLGLANVLLRTSRLDEAEALFLAVKADDSESIDAIIGIAFVQASRGGDGLRQAELTADEVVAHYPSLAKARYLRGVIYERKGLCAAAMGEFKRAAELAIDE